MRLGRGVAYRVGCTPAHAHATHCSNLESQLEDERRRVNSTPTAARQLQAQLRRLQMEKVELENQLEAEQEAIVNKLQKRLRQAEEQKWYAVK